MPSLPAACLFVLASLATPSWGTTTLDTKPIKLDAKERRALQREACSDPFGVSIKTATAYVFSDEIYSDESDQAEVQALVDCKPHALFGRYPIYYRVYCKGSRSIWSCDGGTQRIQIQFHGRRMDLIPGPFTAAYALSVIEALAATKLPKSVPTQDLFSNYCEVLYGDIYQKPLAIQCNGRHFSGTPVGSGPMKLIFEYMGSAYW